MEQNEIIIPVKLDEKTFRRFARYDMFALRRRWVRPAVFALILIAFAAVALLARREQSGLIAAVLLAVGVGLPLVYFGSFLSQVNMQALRLRLNPARHVYTVTLREEGIEVVNRQKEEAPLSLPWKDVRQAIARRDCVYLYVSPVQAFLLPRGQADRGDAEMWAYLTRHMGADKCRGRL